jgi:hypothetical protein
MIVDVVTEAGEADNVLQIVPSDPAYGVLSNQSRHNNSQARHLSLLKNSTNYLVPREVIIS